MRLNLFLKAFAVMAIALVLLIPLMMIYGQIEDRHKLLMDVEANVASSSAGPQQLIGPLVVLDYTVRVARETKDEKTGHLVESFENEARQRVFVPKELVIKGDATVEERNRGLYKAQLYHLNSKLSGRFAFPQGMGLGGEWRAAQTGRAHLVLGISDLRGIRNRPVLQWHGKPLEFEPAVGHDGHPVGRGIQVALDPAALEGQAFAFEMPLDLTGTQRFSVTPVAERTEMTLRSDWPDPSFAGRFLPDTKTVSPGGFEARWQVSSLARDLSKILDGGKETFRDEAFEVSFIRPVNLYLQSERAVKYGFLFVGLTFAAFLLFELLQRLRIHPMQYLLVGLGLAMFFLLLISLAEHIGFLNAYLAASGSCILLLGFYLEHVLRSRLLGWGFAGALALLYGVLYGLLISEDNALLMGSLLLFCALAAAMLATRKLDWYGLGAKGDLANP